jgi:MORN repeat
LYTYLLAHEIAHHVNGDLGYKEQRQIKKYESELRADEMAGFYVGKFIQPYNYNLKSTFLDSILDKIFLNDFNSNCYPAKQYRILAAKAGWIRSLKGSIYDSGIYSMATNKLNFRIFSDRFSPEINNIRVQCTSGSSFKIYRGLKNESLEIHYVGEERLRRSWGLSMFYDDDEDKIKQINLIEYRNDSISNVLALSIDGGKLELHGGNISLELLKEQKPNSKELFIGDRINFKYEGKGTLFFDKNQIYQGDFKDGFRNGDGRLFKNNKKEYEGQFVNNSFQGKGRYFYDNEDVFYGEWKDNKRNGIGYILNVKLQPIQVGCWNNDQFTNIECKN